MKSNLRNRLIGNKLLYDYHNCKLVTKDYIIYKPKLKLVF